MMSRQGDSTKEEIPKRAAREVAELLRVSEGWVRDHGHKIHFNNIQVNFNIIEVVLRWFQGEFGVG